MSLINDMLNDLEKNKDKNNKLSKADEKPEVTLNPEGTPDMPTDQQDTTGSKPPTMPPADNESVKITIDHVNDQEDNAAQISMDSHEDKVTLNLDTTDDITSADQPSIIDPNSQEKMSIPEQTTQTTMDQPAFKQPWETGKNPEPAVSLPGNEKPTTIKTDSIVKNKKPSHTRLIIWIVIITIACGVLAFLYLSPNKSNKAASQNPLAVPSTSNSDSISITKEAPNATPAEAINNTPAEPQTETSETSAANSEPPAPAVENTTESQTNHTASEQTISHESTAEPAIELQPAIISPEEQAQNSYNEIMAQLNTLSSYQAIQAMQKVLTDHPNFIQARTTLAAMLIKYGKENQALTLLEKGLDQSPSNKQMAELAAHILVGQDKITTALKILKIAQPATIQADPDFYALMAGLYLQTKEFNEAHTFYQALANVNPQNGTWWAGLAISAQKLGLQQDAANAYNQAETVGNISPALEAYLDQTMQGS